MLTKLTRTLAAALAANGGGVHPTSKAAHEQALELLTQSVLPAMSLVPGNAGAARRCMGNVAGPRVEWRPARSCLERTPPFQRLRHRLASPTPPGPHTLRSACV